jgi:glycerol 2-dehydrogenase (NADP+)
LPSLVCSCLTYLDQVIPKSVTPARIANNSTLVELTQQEIDELHTIDKEHHFRACHPDWTGYGSLGFPDCE